MTTITLEAAYRGDEDGPMAVYDELRATAVKAIAAYIEPHLKAAIAPEAMAEALMVTAEEKDHIDGNEVSGEVSGRYTIDGNPLSFTV